MVNEGLYLSQFQKALSLLDKKVLKQMGLEAAVVEVLHCVVIKLYKPSWANPDTDPLTAKSRIFFSVWVDISGKGEQKISYNIHAFKLRQLKGYAIESTKFAQVFRASFKNNESQWPNVSVKFGPLNLMEGWIKIEADDFENDIVHLCNNFIQIAHLVDGALAKFKK